MYSIFLIIDLIYDLYKMKKQVTVFGATGLIGAFLIDELIKDDSISQINLVTRKDISKQHEKIALYSIDFLDTKEIENCIRNSTVVFSAIGTTQANVGGDKEAYRAIDYDINLRLAKCCLGLKIPQFLLISSGGADALSSSFYLRLKGEIERDIFELKLPSALILRPSLLLGKRKEFRFGERIMKILMPLFSFLLPANYKPIKAERVAQKMNTFSKLGLIGNHVFSNGDLLKED